MAEPRTLLKRAAYLRERVKRYKQAQKLAQYLAAMHEVHGIYETLQLRLRTLADARDTLALLNVEVPVKLPSWGEQVQADLEAVQEGVPLVDPTRNHKRKASLSAVNNALQAHEQAIGDAWCSWIGSEIPPAAGEVLNVLRRLPTLKDVVSGMEEDYGRIDQLKKRLPSQDSIAEVRRRGERLKEGWQKVGGHELPADVAALLQQAGTHAGASLDVLTPQALAWIHERRVADSFRITFRNASTLR